MAHTDKKLSNFEDLTARYKFNFIRGQECNDIISEDEVVAIFNNTEELSQDLLTKCETDLTGIYYTICGTWYSLVKGNPEKAFEYMHQGHERNCILATWDILVMSLNSEHCPELHPYGEVFKLSNSDQFNYIEKVVNSGAVYPGMYSFYAILLISNTQDVSFEMLQDILLKGLNVNDFQTMLFIVRGLLSDDKFEAAQDILIVAHKWSDDNKGYLKPGFTEMLEIVRQMVLKLIA